jgi:hypothetical protein
MTLDFDPNNRQLKQIVDSLKPTPGYCLILDIVDSTALKDQDIRTWMARIHNTFRNIQTFLPPPLRPLKGIGDSLMFFVSDADLNAHHENALTVFYGLAGVLKDWSRFFCELKAAAVHGEAYEVTFLRGHDDVYGKDIDLTARLLSLARPSEIVMSSAFVAAVRRSNGDQFPKVGKITGPKHESFKGFSIPVEVFRCIP